MVEHIFEWKFGKDPPQTEIGDLVKVWIWNEKSNFETTIDWFEQWENKCWNNRGTIIDPKGRRPHSPLLYCSQCQRVVNRDVNAAHNMLYLALFASVFQGSRPAPFDRVRVKPDASMPSPGVVLDIPTYSCKFTLCVIVIATVYSSSPSPNCTNYLFSLYHIPYDPWSDPSVGWAWCVLLPLHWTTSPVLDHVWFSHSSTNTKHACE